MNRYPSQLASCQNYALSVWPKWVHDMYDEQILVARLTNILRGPAFGNIHAVRIFLLDFAYIKCDSKTAYLYHQVNLPLTATELSFWVATNLPFKEKDRITLLRINSASQRLRFEISLVQMVS